MKKISSDLSMEINKVKTPSDEKKKKKKKKKKKRKEKKRKKDYVGIEANYRWFYLSRGGICNNWLWNERLKVRLSGRQFLFSYKIVNRIFDNGLVN